ncbi:MAG: prepilin-type N-terminal cleavage/methylation domain-containing protein [Desulfovibrionales bacterium]|nr:prepilin-type N-terminal cleavage/methylation domain-containing protein [Desulfovibrionales bacterium]
MFDINQKDQKRVPGFSLIELLIAIAISGIVLSAVSSLFIMQNKSYSVQEQVAEMQQNARAAMDIMTREIRTAGCDPSGSANASIVTATSGSINFTQDLDGDGNTTGTDENITYSLYTSSGIQKIGRDTGGGNQPVAENIQALTFAYYDSAGNTTAVLADIRQIELTITARTANPDPDYTTNGGYRTCTLTSLITPRNLSY